VYLVLLEVVLFFIFWACSPSTEIEKILEESGSLDILTYNIHGLPSAVTGDDTQARITQIAPMLSGFDLVGLQEDWIDEFYPILTEGSDLEYSDRFDEPLDDKVYGAGLSFLGTYPVLDFTHIYYTSCYGLLDNASDCFASKGLQRIEVEIAESTIIHIYNTHLEAGNGPEDHDVRTSQIDEILTQLNGYSQGFPVILMGDFNLEPDKEEEAVLLNHLREQGGVRQTCMEVDCPEPNHIDQMYIRSGDEIALYVFSWERMTSFIDQQGVELSDHPAIMSQIRWER
jgi:endonuclease/exonuclease/phosphatase family metal-dependent hydrolase